MPSARDVDPDLLARIQRATTSVLAELDLAQRREGDVLGASQSGGRSTLRLLRVLEHADIIDSARTIAVDAVERDPGAKTPGFADAVTQTNLVADGDWIERA